MLEPITLRESTVTKEGPLQVSKALKIQLLIDETEMSSLLEALEQKKSFSFYYVQGLCQKGEGIVSKRYFLQKYQHYIELIKEGKEPPIEEFRKVFSSIISCSSEILYSVPLENSMHLLKATRPVIQLQPHAFHYSNEDGEFRPMVFGQESVSWGLQLSYPQLFQDPVTQDIVSIKEQDEFPNTALFKTFQKWVRANTIPTPFIVEGKKTFVPIRCGKNCFAWIHNHPQLKQKGITVDALC